MFCLQVAQTFGGIVSVGRRVTDLNLERSKREDGLTLLNLMHRRRIRRCFPKFAGPDAFIFVQI
jgi:hypothetical protein